MAAINASYSLLAMGSLLDFAVDYTCDYTRLSVAMLWCGGTRVGE
jgi:hypothetical protein